ncbi:MAG: HlyC/CorC family transporter [Anaerolineae bacterium]|nr:HlyC/CorC family transporter [Anaerolineae bacterium]
MGENSGLIIIALLLLLGVNAIFTMTYQTLTRARKSRLRQMADDGHRGAARALVLAEDPARLTAAMQLGTILVHFLTATVVVLGIDIPVTDWLISLGVDTTVAGVIRYVVIIPLAAAVAVLFGEMLPGAVASHHAERFAIALTPWANALTFLFEPFARALFKLSALVAAPFVGDEESMTDDAIEEDIMILVDVGKAGGVIEEEEKAMIHSIFQFTDTLVREVMVPRIDVVALEINTPLDAALSTIVEAGHSRIPVYRESIDHIKGILYAKDLLTLWQNGGQDGDANGRAIADLLRDAYFIPEAKKAFDLLAELQQRKVHIAIVVDEYGGTAGLVTIEDLIEEIVGEIQDEYDLNEEAAFEQVGDREYIFDARIDLDDLNRILDSDLDTDIADTLGGYIFAVIGRAPEIGESFEEDDVTFKVLGVTGRRIRKVHVRRLPPPIEDSRGELDASPD